MINSALHENIFDLKSKLDKENRNSMVHYTAPVVNLVTYIVKSGFVIADMCLITAVLLHGSKERGGPDDTK
jgi:hypothetical protein